MPALPANTYRQYAELLEQRIATKQHLTEDSVRYSFFIALLRTTDIQQHDIILELPHPHPNLKGKEVDTYIRPTVTRPEIYIEFKFHRISKSTSPKPLKAGTLFKDFNRLSSIKTRGARRLVVYLSDSEMARYFEKHGPTYSGFWREPTGGTFIFDESFIAGTTETFRKASGELHSAKVLVSFSDQLPHDYHLRVFEIDEI